MIMIQNDGPEIVATNYWESGLNTNGIVGISLNAGTFRIFLPDILFHHLEEMAMGEEVIVSKGRIGSGPGKGGVGYEFLFEDNSSYPYVLQVGVNQFLSPVPADSEHGKDVRVAVWVGGEKCGGVATYYKPLELPGRFRVVSKLPCYAAWGDEEGC